MPNKNNQSPEQLIQLHLQYDFEYANFREGVAGWVIMGLAAMVEHETTFKSYTSVVYPIRLLASHLILTKIKKQAVTISCD